MYRLQHYELKTTIVGKLQQVIRLAAPRADI
jgi:hypothetical protein